MVSVPPPSAGSAASATTAATPGPAASAAQVGEPAVQNLATFRPAHLSRLPLPELDTSIAPWPGHHVQLGGRGLYVRSTPFTGGSIEGRNAEPALFVHGLGGSSQNWTDLAAQLSPWLDGESIDLPGFGRSGPASDDNYAMTGMLGTLIGYLEDSGRGPVHLFGNSMGGLLSLLLAATRPDLVRTLTLVSPAVPDLRLTRVKINPLPLLLIPGVGNLALRRAAAASPRSRAKATMEFCVGDPARIPANRMAEAITEIEERSTMPWSGEAMLKSLRGLVGSYLIRGPRNVWSLMTKIQAPTLVVWGERDRLVDVALAARTAKAIPNSRLLVLPGVGHVAQMEDPVSTARAFVQMLIDTAQS